MKYDLIAISQGTVTPSRVGEAVRTLLLTTKAWEEIEPYLLPPGIEGSRQFDHAYAVMNLRKHDKDDTLLKGYTGREIWDALVRELRRLKFKVQHGRVTGLIEIQKEDEKDPPLESGEPDVE